MRISKHLCLVYRLATSEKNADGEVPLYIRLTGGKRAEISPGIRLLPDHWDKEANRVKKACKQAFAFNRLLSAARSKIEEIELRLSLTFPNVSAKMVKAEYDREMAQKAERDLSVTPTGDLTESDPAPGIPDNGSSIVEPEDTTSSPPVCQPSGFFFSSFSQEKTCRPVAFQSISAPLIPSNPTVGQSTGNVSSFLAEVVPGTSPSDKSIQVVVINGPNVFTIAPGSAIPSAIGLLPPTVGLRRTLLQALNWKYSKFVQLVKVGLRSGNTLKRWKVTKNKLRDFLQKEKGCNDIFLDEIKYSLAEDFRHFLLTKHKIKPNTAGKYVKNTKELLTIAENREWIVKNKWKGYKINYEQPDRKYLTMPEILTIFQKALIGRLNHVRNIFLFACFTGYAFNEILNLRRTDLFIGNDGRRWIRKNRGKTKVEECIPLLPIAASIVDYYWNHPDCVREGSLLPVKSYDKYNGYLKEIGSICGIGFELTTHVARHTFATTICLDNGVPLEVISRMLGHRSIRTTQIYAKITLGNMSRTMSELERTLFTPEGMLRMELVKMEEVGVKVPNYRPAIAA